MSIEKPFRAKAHLLKLLGDELIGDDRLAIFELVKNAYDADATRVEVALNLTTTPQNIVVHDIDGRGMCEDTILNKWMEIGTDSKRNGNRQRSPKFNRMPLGEKGVGRLAVHKIGSELTINTRSEGNPEYRIHIDWPTLLDGSEYIEDTKVLIEELDSPVYFKDKSTGTRIEIRNLNTTNWTRGEIRRLKRLLTSLVSPFGEVSDFDVFLEVPGREKDLHDVLESQDVLDRAIWRYDFFIDENGLFSYSYSYSPPSLFKELEGGSKEENDVELELLPPTTSERQSRSSKNKERLLLTADDMQGIGPISGTFYIFLRDQEILNALGAYKDIRDYLNEQTGVRIYRDGIRVFNYGEQNEDWLGLNTGRINQPGQKIGTKMILGGIDLDLEKSYQLKEKTNREGFDENQCYNRFRWIISSAIEKFLILHRSHREEIVEYLSSGRRKTKPDANTRFSENIEDIRKRLKKHGLENEMGSKVNQIEADYKQMREVTLSSGIAGINLAVIFHEVERGIDDLNLAIKNNESHDTLLKRSDHLSKLLEGFTPLLRRNEQKKFTAKTLAQRVLDLSKHRFEHHKVTSSCPILTGESPDFDIKGPFGLLQAALNNIIDNSIHWTKLKAETENDSYRPAIRVLTLNDWFKEGPAIVVIDNGPGFDIPPEEAIQPFKTTRPAGMGVGLYYTDKVMETIGGRLILTSAEELDLPTSYTGAAVAMIFKRGTI